MKPLIVILGLVTSLATAHAQAVHYQPIRWDSGLVGTYTPGSGRGGIGAVTELKFNLQDQIAIGARAEAAVQFGGNIDAGGDVSMDIGAVAALLAKGEYYFTTSTARPFVGLSLGMYDIASQSINAGQSTAQIDQKAGRYFGIAPQVGVDLGRARLAVTYNAILGASIEVTQSAGNGTPAKNYSQNYFGFELSFRFGGGRKSDPSVF